MTAPAPAGVALTACVITPSLNQGRFIERTIQSVLDQEYPGLDYVVVDGGSTDETRAVLQARGNTLRWVSEPDRGQAHAVNKGLAMTSAEVVGWLNSDDVYEPGAVHAAAAYLRQHPEVDVVYGDAMLIDAQGTVTGRYGTEPWNPTRLLERCYLCQPAVFLRRRVVERFGALDEGLHYCMDYEYWLRLAAGGARFAYLPQVLAASRLYPETKTLGARLAVHEEINRMLRRRIGQVPGAWLISEAHTRTELGRATRYRRYGPFSVAVAATALRLSLRWNGVLTPSILRMALAGVTGAASARWGLVSRPRHPRP